MTRLALETVELLSSLDFDGAPCFYPVGTIELARTKERWADHRRKLGVAQSWGVPGARLISPEETLGCCRSWNPGEFLGAYHVPVDGIGKPLRSVGALLRRAAAAGVTLVPRTEVTGFDIRAGQLTACRPIEARSTRRWSLSVPGSGSAPRPDAADGRAHHPVRAPVRNDEPVPALAGETREVVHPMTRDQNRAMYYRQHADRYGVGTYEHTPLMVDPRDIRRHGTPLPPGTATTNAHGEALDMPSLRPWKPEYFDGAWAEPAGSSRPWRRHASTNAGRDVLVHPGRLPAPRSVAGREGCLVRRGGLADPRRRGRPGDRRLDRAGRPGDGPPRAGHRPVRCGQGTRAYVRPAAPGTTTRCTTSSTRSSPWASPVRSG